MEFTLQQLYDERSNNLLTWDSYAKAGGLKGAIAKRAIDVYLKLDPVAKEARHRIFASLIHIDPVKGTITRKRVPLDPLSFHPGANTFLKAFLNAHLLITDEDAATREPVVTLVHEALITHWDELSAWIETYRGDLLARQRLAEQTQLWIEGGEKKNYLLSEARLTEAQRVAAGECFLLDSNEDAFLQQSKHRVRKRVRALQASLAAFALLVVAAAGFGLMARSQSSRAERGEKKANQSIEQRMKHSARTDLRRAVEITEIWFGLGGSREESPSMRPEALAYLARAVRDDESLTAAGRLAAYLLAQGGYFIPIEVPGGAVPRSAAIPDSWRNGDPSGAWKAWEPKYPEDSVRVRFADDPGKTIQFPLGSTYSFYKGPVFTPDLSKLAVSGGTTNEGTRAGELKVYDRERSGREIFALIDSRNIPEPLSFSQDNRFIFIRQDGFMLYPADSDEFLAGGPGMLGQFAEADHAPIWRSLRGVLSFQIGKDVYREFGRPFTKKGGMPSGLKNSQGGFPEPEDRSEHLAERSDATRDKPYLLLRRPNSHSVLLQFAEAGRNRLEMREEPWEKNPPHWTLHSRLHWTDVTFHPSGHLLVTSDNDTMTGGPVMLIDADSGILLAHREIAAAGARMTKSGGYLTTEHEEEQAPFHIPLLGDSEKSPLWLANLAEGMGGMAFAPDGTLRTMEPSRRWAAIQSALAEAGSLSNAWSDFIGKFVTQSDISSFSFQKLDPPPKARKFSATGMEEGEPPQGGMEPTPPPAQALRESRPAPADPESRTLEQLFEAAEMLLDTKNPANPANKKASDLYRKAADQGHAPAQFKMGVCHALGAGVEKSDALTVTWYFKAAEQGYADAEYNLGVRCMMGKGVEKNTEIGWDLYRRAARQGHAEAIDALKRAKK